MAGLVHNQGPMPAWLRKAFGMLQTPSAPVNPTVSQATPVRGGGMAPPPTAAPTPTPTPAMMPKPTLDLNSPNNIMTKVNKMARGY
jgi:hypothetical protein